MRQCYIPVLTIAEDSSLLVVQDINFEISISSTLDHDIYVVSS